MREILAKNRYQFIKKLHTIFDASSVPNINPKIADRL
jgi:hypothetical protein